MVISPFERRSPAAVWVNSPSSGELFSDILDVFVVLGFFGRKDVVGDVDEYILVEVVGEMGLDVFVEDVEETGGALVSWERSHIVCWSVWNVLSVCCF